MRHNSILCNTGWCTCPDSGESVDPEDLCEGCLIVSLISAYGPMRLRQHLYNFIARTKVYKDCADDGPDAVRFAINEFAHQRDKGASFSQSMELGVQKFIDLVGKVFDSIVNHETVGKPHKPKEPTSRKQLLGVRRPEGYRQDSDGKQPNAGIVVADSDQ